MKDRLVTLLGGLAALVVVVILFVPKDSREVERVSYPTSADDGRQGLLGLARWFDDAGIPTKDLHRRYDHLLADRSLAATGNFLIISLPQRLPAPEVERRRLVAWVERGNHVLILAAGKDAPVWSVANVYEHEPGKASPRNEFQLVADLGFTLDPCESCKLGASRRAAEVGKGRRKRFSPSDRRSLPEPVTRLLAPQGAHPAIEQVRRVAAFSIPGSSRLRLRAGDSYRRTLVLLRDSESGEPAFWQARVGRGMAWISPHADLFGNVSLGEQDNARFLANLVTIALGPGGRVLFDDVHQSTSELYDPEAFFGDPRLHHTLWFIIVFWLLYLVGRSNRIAPLQAPRHKPNAVDFVRAVGGLFARRGSPSAVGAGMLGNFFNEVRARHRLPTNGEPVWNILASSPRIRSRDLAGLRRAYEALGKTRKTDLIRLTNLVRNIRRSLS